MVSTVMEPTVSPAVTTRSASPRRTVSTPIKNLSLSPKKVSVHDYGTPKVSEAADENFLNRITDDDNDERQDDCISNDKLWKHCYESNDEDGRDFVQCAHHSCTGTPTKKFDSCTHLSCLNGFQTPLFTTSKKKPPGKMSHEKYQQVLRSLQNELRMDFVASIHQNTEHCSQQRPKEENIVISQRSQRDSACSEADDDAHTEDHANFRQISNFIYICGQAVLQDVQYHTLLRDHGITDVINVAYVSRPSFTDDISRGSKRRRLSFPCVDFERCSSKGDDTNLKGEIGLASRDKVIAIESMKLRYHLMECADDENYPILHLDYDFFAEKVDEILSKDKSARIIVHCVAGMNRSSCLCIAYLVDRHGLDIRTAIRRARGVDSTFAPGLHNLLPKLSERLSRSVAEEHKKISVGYTVLSNIGFRKELIQFCANRFPSSLSPFCEDE